ncbi:hypothetical protein NE848_11545 [Gramella jeungdoensis]|uniref:Lipocalin-like domain-containing protein n=1 Tax=Gramella jeungdoensis TaxID=708091 RepID=A0ABT0Z2Q2_9FLAO|nr:hypothetical protein [Gramella jeungdoensis]MCM8570016.1 hypothetical protein [Gramella jeungdoensis]
MRSLKNVLILFSLSLILACDNDKDDIALSAAEAAQLNQIVMQGEWRISNYSSNGNDNTANYSDYIFVFEDDNNLSVTSPSDNINGTWRISNDSGSEFDSYYDVDFNIFFGSSDKLGELTNNYDVISATNDEIKLSLENSPNGNSAYLTFSQN